MRIALPKPMTPTSFPKEELLDEIHAQIPFSGISTSTQELEPGDLFLAFQGKRVDGNDYIETAFSKGAALAVSETRSGERIIRCRRLISLLYGLARMRLEEVSPYVIAVTGSVGKSTYLAYTSALLRQHMHICCPNGNFNTDVGVPLTVLSMPEDTEVLLLELGARQVGDIARLSLLVRPHIAVITRIGHSHLETFGDLQGVLRAKSEILLGLRDGGTFIYNQDDPLLSAWVRGLDHARIGVSLKDGEGDLTLSEPDGDGSLCLRWKDLEINGIQMEGHGEASRLAAALAAATAISLKISPQAIKAALLECHPPSMRQEYRRHKGVLYLMDAYNASPESTVAALQLLASTPICGRRRALLGDMLELGCDAEALHFSIGISAFKNGVTDLYCIGKYSEKTAEGAIFAGMPREAVRQFDTNERGRLIDVLIDDLKKGDALLLKASRAMKLEEVLTALTER